jgi:uncharacterized membrane protein YkvA (DUF1232 family)
MTLFRQLKNWASGIKRDAMTLWFAYRHPHTPWYVKALCIVVVGYAFSPIDLIPDFIPVFGYLDDVLLLPVLIRVTVKLLPAHVLQDSRAKVAEWQHHQQKKPRHYWGGFVIIIIWIAALYGVAKLVL